MNTTTNVRIKCTGCKKTSNAEIIGSFAIGHQIDEKCFDCGETIQDIIERR